MSGGLSHSIEERNQEFSFSVENKLVAKKIIAKYPEGKSGSALVPLLDLAQRQNDNWLPEGAVRYVAQLLDISETRAFEVASIYTMFRQKPCGKYLNQMCKTTT